MPERPSFSSPDTDPVTPRVPHARSEPRVTERELRYRGYRFTCRVAQPEHPTTEPLVILGGSSQDRNSWVRHERRLAEIACVVTVDLPGYGDSDFLPVEHGMDFLAAAVHHMLASLEMPRVNLVGACFGGAIAMRLAQQHPSLIGRLLLVGMARQLPRDYAEVVDRWREQVKTGQLTDIADELVTRFTAASGAEHVRRLSAVARFLRREFLDMDEDGLTKWVEHNERLVAHDWYRTEPMPPVPTLVVTGEHDILTPPEESRALAAGLPLAHFTTIREADHLAPVERVAEFAELVARFCSEGQWHDLDFCHPVESFDNRPVPA